MIAKIKCILFGIHTPSGYVGFNGVNKTSTCQCCLSRIEEQNGKWLRSL